MIGATQVDNPFPGLRSFEPNQADIFFGRDEEIEELFDRLHKHRFVAVVGTSGSGKSSLVRAGLIPVLERNYVGDASVRWRIAILRPGRNATVELASALTKSFGDPESETTLTALIASSAGLAKLARQRLGPGERLLVLVDQFEELFRYRDELNAADGAERSAAFVKLLLAASGHNDHPLPGLDDVPVYVVITMRSDFLGKCAQFRGLPEALNESQYLVPRMTREEQREVIEGPVGMVGARIAARLVQRLLNEVGDNPDQLPVLQHVLMRTWEQSQDARARGNQIELKDYDDVGGMSEALNRDVDQAFAALQGDEAKETIARRLFQRLVEVGRPDEETRRPTPLSEVVAVMGGQEASVVAVIEVFRARGFVTISRDEDPIVDITHESLIRNWKRLGEWILQESGSAAIYRRLADTADLHRRDEAALLVNPQLQLALNWREETQPNEAWAARYHSGFAQAIAFLDESRDARQRAIDKAERERKRDLRRARWIALVFGGLFLIAAVALIAAIGAKRDAVTQGTRAELERAKGSRVLYDANITVAQRVAGEGQFSRAQNLLDELSEPGLKDLRGFEWFHLWRVLHGEDAMFTGHSGLVRAVIFSPDGKILASCSDDKTAKLWDVSQRKELATITGHSNSVLAVALSPDGETLATASSDRTVKLWDTTSRKELATLTGHSGSVWAVAFSPDGKTLATGSEDTTVKLWDVASRAGVATLTGHSDSLSVLVFSPDGKILATGSDDKTVKLWDTASRKEVATLTGHSGAVWTVAFSPNGKRLATGSDDRTVKLWDTVSRKEVATINGHSDPVWAVAFSPDGLTLATGSLDKTVKLWDTASNKELATLRQSGSVSAIAFSPDGKTLATGSADKTVKLWDATSPRELATLTGHVGPVLAVAFSLDGKTLVTGGRDRTVKLWDTTSRKELAPLTSHSGTIFAVAFSPDKTVAIGGSDQTVKLWDAVSHNELGTFTGHSGAVLAVAFSPDGKILASGGADKTVKLWDTASRRELATLTGHSDLVRAIAFSPDGKTLATGSNDKTVKLWDIASHKELATLTGHSDFVLALAFSPNGRVLASGGLDRAATGREDEIVKLWDATSHQELATLTGYPGSVLALAFSPDGKTLATGSRDKTVKLWDTTSGKELVALMGHSGAVWAVAFSPDGKTLATGSDDATVKLWLGATEKEVAERRAQSTSGSTALQD